MSRVRCICGVMGGVAARACVNDGTPPVPLPAPQYSRTAPANARWSGYLDRGSTDGQSSGNVASNSYCNFEERCMGILVLSGVGGGGGAHARR